MHTIFAPAPIGTTTPKGSALKFLMPDAGVFTPDSREQWPEPVDFAKGREKTGWQKVKITPNFPFAKKGRADDGSTNEQAQTWSSMLSVCEQRNAALVRTALEEKESC